MSDLKFLLIVPFAVDQTFPSFTSLHFNSPGAFSSREPGDRLASGGLETQTGFKILSKKVEAKSPGQLIFWRE
jgi:hypothetical protein